MIELRDLCYVRLGTGDLDGAERFTTEIVGLQPIERTADRLKLRSNHRHHSLCYFKGDQRDHQVGIELMHWDALDDALEELTSAGVECERGTAEECADRSVENFFWFLDPTGNRIVARWKGFLVVGTEAEEPRHAARALARRLGSAGERGVAVALGDRELV